jgi:hypothetical protein
MPEQAMRLSYHRAAQHGERLAAEGEICWGGCMFPNDIPENPETWQTILKTMIEVGEAL